jgi:PKD repeat protein
MMGSMSACVSRRFGTAAILILGAVTVACESRGEPSAPPEQGTAAYGAAGSVMSAEPVFVGATSSQTSGGSIRINAPAGLQPGDVMIAQVSTQGSPAVNQPPADWVLIRGDYDGTHANSYVYWKRAEASEPSNYTWSISGSTRIAGGIAAYRNITTSDNPIEAHGGRLSAASTTIIAPSITTTSEGAYLIALFTAASNARETDLSFSGPAGMTARYDISSQTKGNHRNVVVMHASAPLSAAGATGTRAATLSAARPGWGQMIALTAGTSAPPPPPPPPANRPPVASAGGPYAAHEGAVVNFDGSASSDPDGDALTYSWSFGDGSSGSGSGSTPAHVYADNGTYDVVLTVTDTHGASHQSTAVATITNVPPVVHVNLSAGSVGVGESVTATGGFSDSGVADAPWSWQIEWGDGSVQSGSTGTQGGNITASRTYASAGSYTVRLTVTDKDGGAGTAQQTLTVTTVAQPDIWYTDFSEHTTGQVPAGWSQPYAVSNYHVAAVADATGGKVLQNTITGLDHFALAWDAVGSQTDVDLETVARVVSGRNGTLGLMARGTAGRNFYSSRLDEGKNQWIIARYNSGSSHYFATWTNPYPVGTWVRHRFRVEGNTLKAKIWAANTAEPTDWTLQAVDPSPLGSGFAGVWMRYGTTTNQFDWVRVTKITEPAPPVTTVLWSWSGAPTEQGAMVRTRLSAPTPAVRMRVSTDSLFRSYTETGTAATGGNDVATFSLAGLASDTRYYYRPVVGDTEFPSMQGAFRTFQPAGSAYSFTFAMGACQRTDSNKAVFDHIRATAPLFWLQTGDIHYRNIAVNDIDQFRFAYNRLHDMSRQAALYRSAAIVHVWDDHDGAGGNDTDRTKAGWPAVKAAYRENVPHYNLVEGPGGAIYHSFVVGRVRFIVSDLRSERSPKAQTDDAAKTMMGATQKQHFKAELAEAKAQGQFVAWLTTLPWIAAPTAGADHWGGYDTERRELAAYIESIGIGPQMFALSGDMHATAIDSGVNNSWGGFPIFNAGPIDQTSSTKGGPYSHGPFTNGTLGEQFGVVSVTDNGGSTIQVTFSGRRNGSAIAGAHYQFTLTLN